MSLEHFETREDVLRFISKSASYGNLGLFIGTGFSKAVLNDNDSQIALSWGELLEQVSEKLEIDYESIPKEGVGYPGVATILCSIYAQQEEISYPQALNRLKREIALLTSWYPDQQKREIYGSYLDNLSPTWIITTNYDLVVESLLVSNSFPLGPHDYLTNPRGIIPVYHLHGIRTNPQELIITQEDYISLFRPSEYRQTKLALTVVESTVLLLGYGLGDVNVLTALDWSKNVYKSKLNNFPQDVIQVVRKASFSELPYRDQNGILIVETDELSSFFEEFEAIRNVEVQAENDSEEAIAETAEQLSDPDKDLVDSFIDDREFRYYLIELFANMPIYKTSAFITFVDKCISAAWLRTGPSGAFEGYNQLLIILLDILIKFEIDNMSPALLQAAAYSLNQVAYYVGTASGQSWSAAKTWDARKGELSEQVIEELDNIAARHSYNNLQELLSSHP
jgi:hypothetical protein